jgi:hypothetical protein
MPHNYHIRLARYGYTFAQIERIAARLAVRTGRARLAWVNRKGRAHIIAEGASGYRHVARVNPAPNEVSYSLAGHVPPFDSIDWRNGALVECTPCFADELRPTPETL